MNNNLAAEFSRLRNIVSGTFAKMEIIEDEIRKQMENYFDKKDIVFNTFVLCQTFIPCDFEKLLRAHVKCQVERVLNEDYDSLSTPSDAEIVYALSQASVSMPLNHSTERLYSHLFEKLFPEDSEKIGFYGGEAWTDEHSINIKFISKKLDKVFGDVLSHRFETYKERYMKEEIDP